MVNLGRPSRGCDVCRKRRIKCDEALPSCSYCVKRQLICPGYKSQFDVAWRDQNLVAERSVQRRTKASENVIHKQLVLRQLSRSPSPTVYGGLTEDRLDYAVNFFLSSYIVLPEQTEMQRGFLDCLYPIWTEAPHTSPVKIAVASVACYLLEAWSLLNPVGSSMSTSLYLKGVAALRQSIESTGQVQADVLMAALMLQMYENLRAFSTSQFSGDVHVSGATALVRQQKQPFTDETSQRLLLGIRNQIVGRAVRTSTAIPPAVAMWGHWTRGVRKKASHKLDEINMDVADFQALVSGLGSNTSNGAGLVSSLLDQAEQLNQRLLAWLTTIPPSWIPVRLSGLECIPQTVCDAGMYQDYCDIYPNVFVADQINSQRCSRIRIHLGILACLQYSENAGRESTSTKSFSIIQELADEICACVPHYLGDRVGFTRLDDRTVKYPYIAAGTVPFNHHTEAAAFAGFFLTGRLSELLSPKLSLREGQYQWIIEQMLRIKSLFVRVSHV
ncbi:hypothetical protein EJ08DRAFT_681227 [Tothia fuscella]|uniref:Zn(2)-C6 fungal-type domain-containing protein n=1 Tax=Tothia fuscella TaxID=1048955 RepID=A0A9P4NM33_9PEZI|nr:hypothetical protein EJ08DRAFT_681227 [Tothia fuscella]